jgi:hypothetical protein
MLTEPTKEFPPILQPGMTVALRRAYLEFDRDRGFKVVVIPKNQGVEILKTNHWNNLPVIASVEVKVPSTDCVYTLPVECFMGAQGGR